MELQHLNIKVFAENINELNPEIFNPVFQAWIQKKLRPELLIDVASYLHVPAGPGIILVGLEADYSFDNTDNRWGLRFNQKSPLEGSNAKRLQQVTRSALEACQLLEEDPKLAGKLKFKTNEIELSINDRALAPNTPEAFVSCKPELEHFFEKLFDDSKITLARNLDSRRRFTVNVQSNKLNDIKSLLKNISE